MLEGTTLDNLPQDILDHIWSIYSIWRNHKLWESRFGGFLHRTVQSRMGTARLVTNIDKYTINSISNRIKYSIPDVTKGFQNYFDMLYLDTKVDVEAYRIVCVNCLSTDNPIALECRKCNSHFCTLCSGIIHVKFRYAKSMTIIEKCTGCNDT